MISYELAKKLKDAGFEQPVYQDEQGLHPHDAGDDPKPYEPTLSELILACGSGENGGGLKAIYRSSVKEITAGGALIVETTKRQPTIWIAVGCPDRKGDPRRIESDAVSFSGEGDTPEEAVAVLYLALYNKDFVKADPIPKL